MGAGAGPNEALAHIRQYDAWQVPLGHNPCSVYLGEVTEPCATIPACHVEPLFPDPPYGQVKCATLTLDSAVFTLRGLRDASDSRGALGERPMHVRRELWNLAPRYFTLLKLPQLSLHAGTCELVYRSSLLTRWEGWASPQASSRSSSWPPRSPLSVSNSRPLAKTADDCSTRAGYFGAATEG